MTGLVDSLLAASVLIGLVATPLSADLGEATQEFQAEFNPLDNEEGVPRETTRQVDEETFQATQQTAFGQAKIETESSQATIELENPDSRLSIVKEPGKTEHKLTTDLGKLEKKQEAQKTTTKVETPKGTLLIEEDDGEATESFSGSDKSQVSEIHQDLEKLLGKKLEEVEDISQKFEEETVPEVDINVDPDTEVVEITNQGMREISTTGWVLKDDNGSLEEELPERSIEPGQTLYVITDDQEDTETEIYLGRNDNVWSTAGDGATLKGEEGNVLAQESW